MGDGEIEADENDEILLPTDEGQYILCDGSTEEDLITETYENMLEEGKFSKMTSRVILAPRNKEVDRLNEKIMDK